MAEYDGYDKNFIVQAIFNFFISAVNKTKLVYGEGEEIISDTALVFSHGRTATPLMYSQILLAVAQRDINVYAVQHT